MTKWPQHEMFSNPRGKILAMDSAGYVDERNDVSDVLVCGSHGALRDTTCNVGET